MGQKMVEISPVKQRVDDSTAWDIQGWRSAQSSKELMTQQHGTDKGGDQPSQVSFIKVFVVH